MLPLLLSCKLVDVKELLLFIVGITSSQKFTGFNRASMVSAGKKEKRYEGGRQEFISQIIIKCRMKARPFERTKQVCSQIYVRRDSEPCHCGMTTVPNSHWKQWQWVGNECAFIYQIFIWAKFSTLRI